MRGRQMARRFACPGYGPAAFRRKGPVPAYWSTVCGLLGFLSADQHAGDVVDAVTAAEVRDHAAGLIAAAVLLRGGLWLSLASGGRL